MHDTSPSGAVAVFDKIVVRLCEFYYGVFHSFFIFRFMYAHATTFLILDFFGGFLVTSHRPFTGMQLILRALPGLVLSSLCQGTVWPEDGSSAKGFHGNCDLENWIQRSLQCGFRSSFGRCQTSTEMQCSSVTHEHSKSIRSIRSIMIYRKNI